MSQQRVLIVDDEKNMRHMLEVMLGKAGYSTESAKDGKEALQRMDGSSFSYILCDIKMPRMDGMAFLNEATKRYPGKTYIMMSAYGTVQTALEAIKQGAYDYISKPFKKDEVLLTLKKAEEREKLKEENLRLKTRITEMEKRYNFDSIIARSEAMAHVFDLVEKVANHKTTVLITGESGTGKELVAKAIHDNSSRAEGPLVSINCGGIPENLLESELFGYRKGAFTNAVKDKIGRFQEADGGTIFLDEVGELPLSLQVKILRVLQEEELTPLGSTGAKKIDVRVIAATSKDLKKEVSKGCFREDLFYRINVMPVHLPPLRERKGDIPLLVGHFIDQFNKKLEKKIEAPTSSAVSQLMDYSWPGNVRELENVIERAVLLAQGPLIGPPELPPELSRPVGLRSDDEFEGTLSIKRASRQVEKRLIERALKKTGGNRSRAAKLLEISRPILLSKIKEYGLDQ